MSALVGVSGALGPAALPMATRSMTPGATGDSGVSAIEVWTLIVASAAVIATVVAALLLRRTGKGTVQAAERSATAADKSAEAAREAASLTTVAAQELESRSRREEVMRSLRWAAELALSDEPVRADMGVNQLLALSESDLTDPVAQAFVWAALDTVTDAPADAVEEDPTSEVIDPFDAEPGDPDVSSGDDLNAGGG